MRLKETLKSGLEVQIENIYTGRQVWQQNLSFS